jgi:hypothetical protein
VVTPAAFEASLLKPAPPAGLAVPLQALWWAGRNEWDKAHALVMSDDGKDAAWVHAYLHRVEGDLSNAGYWYRRAARTPQSAPFEREWQEIVSALLDRD